MRLAAAALAVLVGIALSPLDAYAASTGGSPSPSPAPSSTGADGATGSTSHDVTFGAGPAGPLVNKHGKVVKVHGKIKYVLDRRPYFTYDVSPGSVDDDHIELLNYANRPQQLNVYTVDATTATNGDFSFAPRAAPRKLAGAWISVGTPKASGEIVVPARSRTVLPIHIAIPANAPPGDHAAAVIVSLTSEVKGKNRKVALEQRVANRVIIRVSGPLHPQLSIQDLRTHYKDSVVPFAKGTATVSYTVANTGNVILGGAQHVTVHGLFGASATAVSLAAVPPLLPGGRLLVTARVPGIFPEISETAKVQVTPEGLRGAVNPGLKVETASVHFWAIPWLLLLIILLVIAAIAAEVYRRRRRKSTVTPAKGAKVTPQGAHA